MKTLKLVVLCSMLFLLPSCAVLDTARGVLDTAVEIIDIVAPIEGEAE